MQKQWGVCFHIHIRYHIISAYVQRGAGRGVAQPRRVQVGAAWQWTAAVRPERARCSRRRSQRWAGGGQHVAASWRIDFDMQHEYVLVQYSLYLSVLVWSVLAEQTLKCWGRDVHETDSLRGTRGSGNKLDWLDFSVILCLWTIRACDK